MNKLDNIASEVSAFSIFQGLTKSSIIEPVMIVMLGGGVAVLLAAVLVPIYNIAGAQ